MCIAVLLLKVDNKLLWNGELLAVDHYSNEFLLHKCFVQYAFRSKVIQKMFIHSPYNSFAVGIDNH